jgi:hypothetical protein
MYFKNIEEKEKVINKYNSYNRVSKRDIDRMNLDRYRVNLDVKKISNFLDRLKSYRLC